MPIKNQGFLSVKQQVFDQKHSSVVAKLKYVSSPGKHTTNGSQHTIIIQHDIIQFQQNYTTILYSSGLENISLLSLDLNNVLDNLYLY